MKRLIFLLSLSIYLSACAQTTPQKTLVTPLAFQQEITAKKVQLVDVRTPEEFKEGKIDGAINIDYKSKNFMEDMSHLDKSEPVYIYCFGGGRSADAAKMMVEKGYNIVELEGGILNWRKNELPVADDKAQTDEVKNYSELMKKDKIVVIDFYADWCTPCKRMIPSLEKLDKETDVTVIRINADKNPDLCKKEGVTGLPVVKYYKDGVFVTRTDGFIAEKELFELVKNL